MSVRKHKLAPQHQRYGAEDHILVNASGGKLSKGEFTRLHKYRDKRLLGITGLKAESLEFLAEWKELRSLTLAGCTIADCSTLVRLKKLKLLWYNGHRRKSPDLSFLSLLKGLEELGVLHMPHLTSFPDLSKCKRLKRLTIAGCKRLVDIDAIPRIPKLESFGIVNTPQQPADLEPIMGMKSLKTMSGAFGSGKRDGEFERLLERYGLEYG